MTALLARLVSWLNRRLQARLEAQETRKMLKRFPGGTRVRVTAPCSDCAKYHGQIGVVEGLSTNISEYRVKLDTGVTSWFKPSELERVQ